MIAEAGLLVLVLGLFVAAVGTSKWRIPAGVRYALPALAFLALMGLFFWRLNQTGRSEIPAVDPSASIGKPAPSIALPPLFAGQPELKSADLRGRVTLVNFFASWCVPCRAEHPMLGELANAGVVVVGINYKDKPGNAKAFLGELGNPYRVVAMDRDGRAGADFGVYGVPETYLIDKNGVIRFRLAGPLTREIVSDELLPLANKLK
jgi:DsbE subfamily thiol:disulfide oxidoreductase